MQNIPSHNKEIRMLFKAGYTNKTACIEDSNILKLGKNTEVLTKRGWIISDKLLSEDLLELDDNSWAVIVALNASEALIELKLERFSNES